MIALFLFDTDHIGILQAQSSPELDRILARMAAHSPDDFFVSIISFHEQVSGWTAYLNRARTSDGVTRAYAMFERILEDLTTLQVLPFDDAASEVFESFRGQRIRVGTMDLRIAAIAIAKGMTVLSRNLSDFQRIPGLVLEDWTLESSAS